MYFRMLLFLFSFGTDAPSVGNNQEKSPHSGFWSHCCCGWGGKCNWFLIWPCQFNLVSIYVDLDQQYRWVNSGMHKVVVIIDNHKGPGRGRTMEWHISHTLNDAENVNSQTCLEVFR